MPLSVWAGASKKTPLAGEQNEVSRREFRAALAEVPLDKLVFFDECGFGLNLHPLYGWLIGGGRLEERVPVHKGRIRSVVGAYSLPSPSNPSGLWALWQRLGSWNARLFTLFVQEAVLPFVPKGSVLVLDNAPIHKGARLKQVVEEAGCVLLFLPPYSPDFNPVELLWSWLKHFVRDRAPRDDGQRQKDIRHAAQQLPPQHAQAWFHKCGLR